MCGATRWGINKHILSTSLLFFAYLSSYIYRKVKAAPNGEVNFSMD